MKALLFSLIVCSITCLVIAVCPTPLFYEPFNYAPGRYSVDEGDAGVWHGRFDILPAALTYHDPVLGAPARALCVPAGNDARLFFPSYIRTPDGVLPQKDEVMYISCLIDISTPMQDTAPILVFMSHSMHAKISVRLSEARAEWEVHARKDETLPETDIFTIEGDVYHYNTTYSTPLDASRAPHHLIVQIVRYTNGRIGARLVADPSLTEWPFASEDTTKTHATTIPFHSVVVYAYDSDVHIDQLRVGTTPRALGFVLPPHDPTLLRPTIAAAPWREAYATPLAATIARTTSDTTDIPFSETDIDDAIMIVSGDTGSGTGVLVKEGTNRYLYTNLHVIGGNRRITITDMSGRRYTPREIYAAPDRDLVRLVLNDPPPFALPLGTARRNDNISVHGNAEGADVARVVSGTVLGMGPDTLEVSAEFVQGHSGSPIVAENGSIVGIATYVTYPTTNFVNRDTDFVRVRRFGVRPDTVTTWQPVNPRLLMQQSLLLSEKEKAIYQTLAVLSAWAENPILSTIPLTDDMPDALRRWSMEHNDLTRRVRQSGARTWTGQLRNELERDFERLMFAVREACRVDEPRWHLPQFKQQWDDLIEFENAVHTIMRHIKENLRTN